MRWENGQVSLTSLKTRKASAQECNGVESVHNKTLLSAWAGFAPKLTVTLTVARTKLCTWILRPAIMGYLTAQFEALQMPLSQQNQSHPSTASVPVLLCSFPKTSSGFDVQILANVIVALHDALRRFVVGSVQRRRSVPTVMMLPWMNSHVLSLTELSEVDLSNVSQSPMRAATAANPAVASVAAALCWLTSGQSPAAEPKSQNIATVVIHLKHFQHPCSRIPT